MTAEYLKRGKILYIPDDETIQEENKENLLSKGSVVYEPTEQEIKADKTEQWSPYLKRIGAQLGLRAAEGVAGAPGELMKAISLPGQITESVGSRLTPEFLKEKGIDFGQIIKSPLDSFVIGPLAEVAATREDFRKFSKEKFGDQYEPKTDFEERLGEGLQDTISLAATGTGGATTRIFSALGKSLLGGLTKQVLKDFGASENAQEIGKAGAMIFSSLWNPRLTRDYYTEQYRVAENSIPQNQTWNTTQTNNYYRNLRTQIQNDITSSENEAAGREAIRRIDQFLNNISSPNDRVPIRDLFRFRRALNGDYEDLGPYYERVMRPIRTSLVQYGENYNPVFNRALNEADRTYSAYQDSRRLANSIRNMTTLTPQNLTGQALLKIIEGKPAAVMTLGGSLAGLKTYEMINRAVREPVVARLYGRTLANAARNNTPAFLRDFKKLTDEIEKFGEKKPVNDPIKKPKSKQKLKEQELQ